ncbi:NAD(P)-dependent oxidoreductase [Thermodesulfovibrionales bacterium]|nr:NAD(P)-dependent oxidoreductase [Thermodesulfovibrionales bacterium]
MKSAAVIGANSMLGSRLTAVLSSMGIEVISVGRFTEADIHLDLNKGLLSPIATNVSVDVIFHCAASFADDSRQGVRENFQTNTAGCLWVLELAECLECKAIVYAGSVFSIEALEPGNLTSYGFTKGQAEKFLWWGMKRLGGRFCSLRFSQIYDTTGSCIRHQPWFGRIIAYAARGYNINMPISNGVRNFLHLDDAVHMMIVAGQSTVEGYLDVVHPISLTYEEIAEKAYSIFNKGGQVLIDSSKTPFRPINFPDSEHAFRVLGLTPMISVTEGIAQIRDQETWPAFGPLDVL